MAVTVTVWLGVILHWLCPSAASSASSLCQLLPELLLLLPEPLWDLLCGRLLPLHLPPGEACRELRLLLLLLSEAENQPRLPVVTIWLPVTVRPGRCGSHSPETQWALLRDHLLVSSVQDP